MKRTDPVIIELNCEATPSTDTQTIDRAEWDAMTPAERAVRLNDMVEVHMSNAGGGGWNIEDQADYDAVGSAPTTVPVQLADNPAALDAVQKWLADPHRPSGPVYDSAKHLLARIDAALTGKEA